MADQGKKQAFKKGSGSTAQLCTYFASPKGCRFGSNCLFLHNRGAPTAPVCVPSAPQAAALVQDEKNNNNNKNNNNINKRRTKDSPGHPTATAANAIPVNSAPLTPAPVVALPAANAAPANYLLQKKRKKQQKKKMRSLTAAMTAVSVSVAPQSFAAPAPVPATVSPEEWVRLVLADFQKSFADAPLEAVKSKEGRSCLINNPESTMSHDFIDADGTFPKTMKEIDRALKADPDSRDKPLLATVKGSGGGKTRLFEEIRRDLNEREDTVAIGVTFNNKTSYSVGENVISKDDPLPLNLDLVLSVMTRIAAAVYDKPFLEIKMAFRDSFNKLDRKSLFDDMGLAMFFRSFLNVVIESLAEIDPQGKLKNLVLLMDETIRPLEKRLRKAGVTAERREQIKDHFDEFLSALNQGVLDERLGGATGRKWNAALLISSLDVSPVQKTLSGREITLLPTGVLSSEPVVKDWWRKSVNIESSVVATAKLELLVEVLKTVPRFVQIARDFLASQQPSKEKMLKIDAALVRPLFECVLEIMPGRYSVPQNISPENLFGLIYGRMVKLDEESAYLMRTSFFTNTLNEILEETAHQEFVPQGNLAMLAYYDRRRCKESEKTEEEDWNNPNKTFLNVYRAVINSTVATGSEGDALEKAALGWMMARLIAAQQVGIKNMPLHEFFAVSDDAIPSSDIIVQMPEKIDTKTHKVFQGDALSVLPPISDNYADFARRFNETIKLKDGTVVAVFRTGEGQNCDQMIVFKIAGTDELFIVFVDEKCKQVRVHKGDTDPRSPRAKPLDIAQFFHVEKFVKELETLEKDGTTELSEISKALVKGNYLFVYLTTHPEVELEYDGKKLEEKLSRLVIMPEEASKRFFGILWGLYRAARGLYDVAVVKKGPRGPKSL